MASLSMTNTSNSSSHGEDAGTAAARRANVLASCYLVDATGSLRGFLYCSTLATGLPSPPSSPPLAAITQHNKLVVLPKPAKPTSTSRPSSSRKLNYSRYNSSRRGGATTTPAFRGECERFFCESLRNVFLVERNASVRDSVLGGVEYTYTQRPSATTQRNRATKSEQRNAVGPHGQLTPPDEFPFPQQRDSIDSTASGASAVSDGSSIESWLHVYDYVGGASFGAFVAVSNGTERSLFVFFDEGVVSRDLKKALVALIELAEGPLSCTTMVACIERTMSENDADALVKGLQWAGFSITTLEHWASGGSAGAIDLTSPRWLFMGMEI